MTNTLVWIRAEAQAGEPARLGIAAEREHVPPHDRLRSGRPRRTTVTTSMTSIGTG